MKFYIEGLNTIPEQVNENAKDIAEMKINITDVVTNLLSEIENLKAEIESLKNTSGSIELPTNIAYTDVENTFTQTQLFNNSTNRPVLFGNPNGNNTGVSGEGLKFYSNNSPTSEFAGLAFNYLKLSTGANSYGGKATLSNASNAYTLDWEYYDTRKIINLLNVVLAMTGNELVSKKNIQNGLNIGNTYLCSANSDDNSLLAGHYYLIGGTSANYTYTDITAQ